MQIVIDIPKELYDYMKNEKYNEHLDKRFDSQIRYAVVNAIPLPKGHGRLIDGDELESHMKIGYNIVKSAPTIIEADKAESDHKCHTCKHYLSGEYDGSCDSYICEHYSNWESEE